MSLPVTSLVTVFTNILGTWIFEVYKYFITIYMAMYLDEYLQRNFFVDDTLAFGCYGCLDFKVTDKKVLNQSKKFSLIS